MLCSQPGECLNNVLILCYVAGLPEPPIDIQVEPGPQDGTLLVTWQPATPTSSVGNSLVTGYAVYADGKKVTDVDSPTGQSYVMSHNQNTIFVFFF